MTPYDERQSIERLSQYIYIEPKNKLRHPTVVTKSSCSDCIPRIKMQKTLLTGLSRETIPRSVLVWMEDAFSVSTARKSSPELMRYRRAAPHPRGALPGESSIMSIRSQGFAKSPFQRKDRMGRRNLATDGSLVVLADTVRVREKVHRDSCEKWLSVGHLLKYR